MYAVIQDRGRQFRVSPGDRLEIDHADAEVGAELSFPVMVIADGDKVQIGTPLLKATATAKVLSHGKGPKGLVAKYKRRKDNSRRVGYRRDLTTVEILEIK